mgnify:CR=1 FL=1
MLISLEKGRAAGYALFNLEDRGLLMIGAGDDVYGGMIIGEHNKGNDLEVNPLKAKQLTNFRASGKDDALDLTTPIKMTLEKAGAFLLSTSEPADEQPRVNTGIRPHIKNK